MAELSGIYDAGPIQPVAKIKENLSVFTVGQWAHYKIENIEPLPRSTQNMVEMVVASGATILLAYGTIARRIVAILQLNQLEFIHLRWEPIDDVEGILWQQAGTGRFATRSMHSRVTRYTSARDPYLATTTFWILGRDRDMQLEVRNPNPANLPQARFVFWGFRYKLSALKEPPAVTTYVPAEGFA